MFVEENLSYSFGILKALPNTKDDKKQNNLLRDIQINMFVYYKRMSNIR